MAPGSAYVSSQHIGQTAVASKSRLHMLGELHLCMPSS